MRINTPINYIYTTTHTAEKAYEKVLNYAGCSLSRDWIDALMVSDTQNGVATYTGAGNSPGIIDSQTDNRPTNAASDWNAWPTLNSTTAPTDTDRDGMPDTWETANGLNPNSATDGNSLNADGFTMLEVYMNSLVATIVQSQNAEGTPTGSTISTVVGPTNTATLGKSTYTGSVATTQWHFNNYSITNTNNKGYATGTGDCIKFSTGTKFTVNLPNGVNVVSVKFVGYNNYGGTDSYISELNGNAYSPTAYVFTQKDASGNATTCTHNIAFDSPVSGSFTFTLAGNQTALYLDLTTTTATGLKKQPVVVPNPNALVHVYTIDGRLVRAQLTRSEATETLPNGIYIVDGEKIAIFR
jgi:hypothetical protein